MLGFRGEIQDVHARCISVLSILFIDDLFSTGPAILHHLTCMKESGDGVTLLIINYLKISIIAEHNNQLGIFSPSSASADSDVR